MGDVRVRNLDEGVVLTLKERARRQGSSLEAEVRRILTDEADRPRREMAARLREMRDRFREEFGELPDSTPGIREERDRRG